jgi:nicotinamidase-related amidase
MLKRKEILRDRRAARMLEHDARNAAAVAQEKEDFERRRESLEEDRKRRRAEHEERNRVAREKESLRGVKMRRGPVADKMLRREDAEDKGPVETTLETITVSIFASPAAEDLARAHGITDEDLAGLAPSSARGYTVNDVRNAIVQPSGADYEGEEDRD